MLNARFLIYRHNCEKQTKTSFIYSNH